MLFALAISPGACNGRLLESWTVALKGEETIGRDISVDQDKLGGSGNVARSAELGDDCAVDPEATTPLG